MKDHLLAGLESSVEAAWLLQEKDLLVPEKLPKLEDFARSLGFWASLKEKSDGLAGTTPLMFDLGAAAFTEVAEEKVLKAELE